MNQYELDPEKIFKTWEMSTVQNFDWNDDFLKDLKKTTYPFVDALQAKAQLIARLIQLRTDWKQNLL